MKFYVIAGLVAIAVPLCFGSMISHGDKIEPAFDGGEYSVIAEPNEDDGLNVVEYVIFKGTVKELTDGNAIVVPNEGEEILQSGDLVAIALPEGCQLTVGEEVTVEYDGTIMESYPLQVNVISVNGIQMAESVQAGEDFIPYEGISSDGKVFDDVNMDTSFDDVPSVPSTVEPAE